MTGFPVLAVLVLAAILAPLVAHQDPLALHPLHKLLPPSPAHWFGTDDFGRDLFARVVYGGRISMEVGFSVAVVGALGGVLIGLAAAMYPGLDPVLMRIVDGMMALPGILLAIAMMVILGQSEVNVIITLSAVAIPRMARIVRASAMVVREEDYVMAARSSGARLPRVTLLHVLPNIVSPIVIQSTFNFAGAVLNEAALSFLGVGVPPAIPSWGGILSDGQTYIVAAPWMTLFPGLAIVLTVLCVNLVGEGLRDALDPRFQGL